MPVTKPGDVNYLPQHDIGCRLALMREAAQHLQMFIEGKVSWRTEKPMHEVLMIQRCINKLAEENPEWGMVVDPDVPEFKSTDE